MILNKISNAIDYIPIVSSFKNLPIAGYKLSIDVRKFIKNKIFHKGVTLGFRASSVYITPYKTYIGKSIPLVNIIFKRKEKKAQYNQLQTEKNQNFASAIDRILNGIEKIKEDYNETSAMVLKINLELLRTKILNQSVGANNVLDLCHSEDSQTVLNFADTYGPILKAPICDELQEERAKMLKEMDGFEKALLNLKFLAI